VVARQREEGRQQGKAALDLVRLYALLADEPGEELALRLQRSAKVAPLARQRVGLDPG
jgi:hypothetical protein